MKEQEGWIWDPCDLKAISLEVGMAGDLGSIYVLMGQ